MDASLSTQAESEPPPPSSRGDGRPPLVFRFLDFLLGSVSTIVVAAGYLVTCFAIFALVSAGYAWHSMGQIGGAAQFIHEFLVLAGFLVLYVAAPLFAVACLWLFVVHAWRRAWGQPGPFCERGLPPVVVALAAVLFCGLTWNANVSLGGQWRELPTRVQAVLGMDSRAPHAPRDRDRSSRPLQPPVRSAVILPPHADAP